MEETQEVISFDGGMTREGDDTGLLCGLSGDHEGGRERGKRDGKEGKREERGKGGRVGGKGEEGEKRRGEVG